MSNVVITRATTSELTANKVDTVHIMLACRSVTVTNHHEHEPLLVTAAAVARGATGGDRTPPTPKADDGNTVTVPPGVSVQVHTSDESQWVTLAVAGKGQYTVDPRNQRVVGLQSIDTSTPDTALICPHCGEKVPVDDGAPVAEKAPATKRIRDRSKKTAAKAAPATTN